MKNGHNSLKNILCYGGSTLRGYIPGSFNQKNGLHERYPKHIRWTGILENRLAGQYNVIEEGLAGRTTNLDEINPRSTKFSRNGLKELTTFLDAHYPVDLVIFDLGTNDTKSQFNRSPEEITEGMREIIRRTQASSYGLFGNPPKILVLSPLSIIEPENPHPAFAALFTKESQVKCQKLPLLYQQMTQQEQVEFLDVTKVVKPSKIDGLHLNQTQHQLLGIKIAEKVTEIFNNKLI